MPRTAAIFTPAFRMRLRRFPLVHLPLAFLNRSLLPGLVAIAAGFLRYLVPQRFWFAPPRGWFSDYQQLKEENGQGAIILEDQGNPKLPDPSIMLLCKRTQHQQ